MVDNKRSRAEIELAKKEADLVFRAVELAEKVADGVTDLEELKGLFVSPGDDEMESCYADDSDAAWTAKVSAYRARWCANYLSPRSYPPRAAFRSPSKLDHDREQSAQCHRPLSQEVGCFKLGSGISSNLSLLRTQRLRIGSAVVRVRNRFNPTIIHFPFWSFLANLEEVMQIGSLQDLANMGIDFDQNKPPPSGFHVPVESDERAQLAAIDVPYVAEVQEQVAIA